MDRIRNLSVRKSIVFYMAVSLLCSFLLSALVIRIASDIQEEIWWGYADKNQYYEIAQGEGGRYILSVPRPSGAEMTRRDRFLSEACDFLQTYATLVLSVLGSCAAVFLFYRNKLKRPIEELDLASKNIAANNLEFHISYENADEMGRLCQEFERMRKQLAENNQKLWRMVEDEKALRAAIAHDIRSPLSVLKGYQEMLLEFVADDTADKEQILSMLSAGMGQIGRMNDFIEIMRRISGLEAREVHAEEIDLRAFTQEVEGEINILGREAGKQYEIQTDFTDQRFVGDKNLILEVVENLLSNALRYAEETVKIAMAKAGDELTITISDDGQGFLENPKKVTKAFSRPNLQDELGHFGLGMYLSKLYCEKHGGKLLSGNQQSGGAFVKAIFKSVE